MSTDIRMFQGLEVREQPVMAKLPADVWRLIARSSEPLYDQKPPVSVVAVKEQGDRVYCLSEPQYHRLMRYISSLEEELDRRRDSDTA